MGKLIVIASGKGGVGKSTVAVGLATSLNNSKKSVLLIDADAGLRCLDLMLGATENLVFDLSDVALGNISSSGAIQSVNSNGLYLLAAPSKENSVDFGKIIDTVNNVLPDFDYVIVDCSAGYNEELCSLFPKETMFLIVTNTDAVATRDAFFIGDMLRKYDYKHISMIVNNFKASDVSEFKVNIDNIIDETYIKLLGIVPFDKQIKKATYKGQTFKFGRAAKAFQRIAARVDGNSIPLPNYKKI